MQSGGILVVALLGLSLTACGTSTTDRAISGAGIGAGLGAAGAAVADGNVGRAALIGGAVGAAAGAFTDADTVYLGRPVWRRY
ncbi:MAG TPA: bacteriocin [Thermohalobaculum sp.]|nr:bacteriocin [Thermohalobaculum sp.]